jgi:hypothetical protein
MPSFDKMMTDYRAMGQQAEQALASLPQVVMQSFVPAAFGSLAIWQFRHATPGWLIIASGVVTLIVAVIGAGVTLRQSSAAWGATRVRSQIESALLIANPGIVSEHDKKKTHELSHRTSISNFYYVLYLVQVLFSGFLLTRAF